MTSKLPVNILMVDDQPAKLLSYETILESLGENLIRANSGREALEHLLKSDIAVVLVDVCMPDLDGFELASMIRSHPRFQKTAVILVSGILVDDVNRLKGYDSGAVDYVSVPIVPEILRAKVAVFAELSRKTAELARLNRELEERVARRTAEIEAVAARVRQSEERLRLVLTSSGTQGWTWDIGRDEVMRITPSGESEQLLGTHADSLAAVHAEDRALVKAAFDRAIAGDGTYRAEFRAHDETGERWFLGRGTVIRDSDNAALFISGIDIDISEHKRAENERSMLLQHAQDARREAETANRLKDEFLATLSHELRTPLNAIVGWAHLLRAGTIDAAMQMKAVETIDRNAKLQSQLISDILDVSRIITGKLRLALEPVHLPSLLQAAADSVRPAAESKGTSLSFQLDATAEPILADPARLQQVFWNLLTNAIKFAPAGGYVEVRLESLDSHVRVTVQDDGPGIPPEFLPYIFNRFRQADSSSTRPHHGLGLGLAIVRHLLEMHGGTVLAANRENASGAVFTVVLSKVARSISPLQEEPPPTDAKTPHVAHVETRVFLNGVRVLVVDDEPDAREVLALMLERSGGEVRVAASVAEALALMESEHVDILLSDIEMPDQDGYSLIRTIRAWPADRGGAIPAIALTAYAGGQDRERALSVGFQMHMAKPVEPIELLRAIAQLTERSRGEGQAS